MNEVVATGIPAGFFDVKELRQEDLAALPDEVSLQIIPKEKAPRTKKRSNVHDHIISSIKSNGGEIDEKKLLAALFFATGKNHSLNYVRSAISVLKKDGLIERVSKGVVRMASSDVAVAEGAPAVAVEPALPNLESTSVTVTVVDSEPPVETVEVKTHTEDVVLAS